jgi:hypothetical protein
MGEFPASFPKPGVVESVGLMPSRFEGVPKYLQRPIKRVIRVLSNVDSLL